ncbi:MAG: type II secretion system F family protein [Halobacteria archaeon]|nr:type II secretion system F family protein [Halobacteria archaeon]
MSQSPISTTTTLVVIPLLIAVVPLSAFYELKDRRERIIVNRFPEKLDELANANQMGLSVDEGFRYISQRSEGLLAEEFERLNNDIRWNFDVNKALTKFANRLRIPSISRTVRLISRSSVATGDLYKILSVAADDAYERLLLRRKRYREMSGYIAIIIISFLVYLGVILLLDQAYLTPLVERVGRQDIEAPAEIGTPMSFQNVPVTTYRMVFYHSTLIQALGNGLLAGKMTKDDMMSGLKYSIAFLVITMIAYVTVI